jgi:hypothetical protein
MKTLYVLACGLFLTAIVADVCGKHCFATSAAFQAAMTGTGPKDRALAKQESDAALVVGNQLCIIGFATASLGLAAWLTSVVLANRQGRRAPLVVPLVMLVAYILLFFLVV